MQYLTGLVKLSRNPALSNAIDDVYAFLLECADSHFLDFIEQIFWAGAHCNVSLSGDDMVDEINLFFSRDDVPYSLTPFVSEERKEHFMGRERQVHVVVEYPRVIRKDDEIPSTQAIRPAIDLLRDRGFTAANKEFLDALTDYRHGDYGDCLTKCGSAFESTLKLICDRKQWPYSQKDTASPLLEIVLKRSSLDSFFMDPLKMVATLRNRLSTSHGAGATTKIVPAHVASFAINTTAAGILLLVAECS